MFNRVLLIGHLGADPEIKYSASGACIANMRLAVNDHRKDINTGQTVQQTYWFTIVAFGKTAEAVGTYCGKGSKVGIDGKLIHREWEDNSGQKRNTVEIRADHVEFLSAGGQGRQQGLAQDQYQGQRNAPPTTHQEGGHQGQQGNWPPPPPPSYRPPEDDPEIPF